jgi:predicted transcriptional regulator
LFDKLYEDYDAQNELSDKDKVIELLKDGPKTVKELQSVTKYKSRSTFLEKVLNPLINTGTVYQDGDEKSPSTRIVMKQQNQ